MVDSMVTVHDLFVKRRMNKILIVEEYTNYHCNEQISKQDLIVAYCFEGWI